MTAEKKSDCPPFPGHLAYFSNRKTANSFRKWRDLNRNIRKISTYFTLTQPLSYNNLSAKRIPPNGITFHLHRMQFRHALSGKPTQFRSNIASVLQVSDPGGFRSNRSGLAVSGVLPEFRQTPDNPGRFSGTCPMAV